jgi:putative proteasome-type protease
MARPLSGMAQREVFLCAGSSCYGYHGSRHAARRSRSDQTEAPMTYCVGILVEEGLVMIADTRTNAGLDNISTYRKLSLIEEPGERVLVLASAGNLSLSQSVVSLLTEGLENSDTGQIETLRNAPTLFRAAQLVGRAVRQVRAVEGKAFEEEDLPFNLCFLLGGQISGEPMALYMVYRAGNFIRCERDVPFLQIGEHKYGKPILDRAVSYQTDLSEALKVGLISMDSTMRSNLAVGLPIDIAVIRRDALKAEVLHRIEVDEPYFHDLRERWSAALRAAHKAIPRPPYGPV